MPHEGFYDLGTKPSKETVGSAPKEPKVYYDHLNVTVKQIPVLEDYELGDVVEFHIKTVVSRESKEAGRPKNISLEMRSAKILNYKPMRKEAEEKGLDMESMKEVDSHRKKLKKDNPHNTHKTYA